MRWLGTRLDNADLLYIVSEENVFFVTNTFKQEILNFKTSLFLVRKFAVRLSLDW